MDLKDLSRVFNIFGHKYKRDGLVYLYEILRPTVYKN